MTKSGWFVLNVTECYIDIKIIPLDMSDSTIKGFIQNDLLTVLMTDRVIVFCFVFFDTVKIDMFYNVAGSAYITITCYILSPKWICSLMTAA